MSKLVSDRPSFQGDLMIRRINKIPAGLKVSAPDKGVHVLAHSETGHNHVMESRNAQMFIDETNQFIIYLTVAKTSEIEHLRSFDTHESLTVPPGNYELRRQREHTPEGWRKAQD